MTTGTSVGFGIMNEFFPRVKHAIVCETLALRTKHKPRVQTVKLFPGQSKMQHRGRQFLEIRGIRMIDDLSGVGGSLGEPIDRRPLRRLLTIVIRWLSLLWEDSVVMATKLARFVSSFVSFALFVTYVPWGSTALAWTRARNRSLLNVLIPPPAVLVVHTHFLVYFSYQINRGTSTRHLRARWCSVHALFNTIITKTSKSVAILVISLDASLPGRTDKN